MTTLYQIDADIGSLLERAEDGEIDDQLAEHLDALEMDRSRKIHAIACVIRNKESRMVGLQAELDRLNAAHRAEKNHVEWLKSYLKDSLERNGEQKIETPLFKIRIQRNSQPSVTLREGAAVPEKYRKITVELDKKAVLADHKDGKALPPSVEVVQGTHLRIN